MDWRYIEDKLKGRKSVCLFTPKHTGTHFTMNHFFEMGFQQAFINPMAAGFETMPKGNYFYHLHVEERFHFFDVINSNDIMVTTLRDPRKVFYSHGHRKDISPSQAEAHILFAFKKWRECVEKYKPFILMVDAPDLEDRCMMLAKRLGIEDYKYSEVDRHHQQKREFDYPVPESLNHLAYFLGYD